MLSKSNLFYAALTFCLSGLLTLIALEIGLRFLPVSDTFLSEPVTKEQPVARFKPDRDITWSRHFNFALANKRHINNDGFFNDQDYDESDQSPLMAVIGDSFVEAVMVPYQDTLYGRLEKKLTPDKRAYSFGASGAPLSQYLVWAKHAQEAYHAKKMAFVIISNDFDESLPKYKFHQTFHQFVADSNGTLKPQLIKEYHPNWSRFIIHHSALARYLLMNLQLYNSWNKLRASLVRKSLDEKTLYVGNVPAKVEDERLFDSYKAVDAFFDNLPDYTGLKPRDIVFLVDAPRTKIYAAETMPVNGTSYFEKMRDYFLKTARKRGYETVDLMPVFWNSYQENHQKFESPQDGHWSGYGHGVVYDALLKTNWFKKF